MEHNNTKTNEEKKVNKKSDINLAHKLFSHASWDTTRLSAKKLGWELTGEIKKCKNCSLSKIKTKTLNSNNGNKLTKLEDNPELTKNELFLALDIAKGPGSSYGGNKFWIIIQDMSMESETL